MTTVIQEYSATEAALASLSQKYKAVIFDVKTAGGMETARKGRAELRTYRVSLEKMRVSLKADVLERGRAIDGEAKRITNEIESLEVPIDEQIKKEEQRLEDIRTAKAREEAARVAEVERVAKEAEERRIAEELAKIERQKEELRKAEAKRLADEAESRRKIEDEQRAARLKMEEEERAARKAREAEEDRIRTERKVEQDKIDAERAEIAKQRFEVEEKQRKEREAEEDRQRKIRMEAEEVERKARAAEAAKQQEAQRKVDELAGASALLVSFVSRFGHIEKYAGVVAAIKEVK